NIVLGLFTFVSGEIAKVGPDAMTVYPPFVTVGIRGTKVAGRAVTTVFIVARSDPLAIRRGNA
ncbi:MAG: hypothetical protein VYB59_09480, partial [Pseudomonadota bacterium]|nr:hypothetical protein [Pseudomonadota bacterium]